jgi:predicted RNA-binding protein with PUA-like domain
MRYWLMKSEPSDYSIEDLASEPDQTTHWDGVRNYQARNMLRDQMQAGDQVLFYHSNTKPPGVVGVAEIVRSGYPDYTAFDPHNKHYDPNSDPDNPRWFMVDIRLQRQFKRLITLEELKAHSGLQDLPLVRRGNRLSVMPVTAQQWALILDLE